jgi:hypothetical protein
MLNFGFQFGRMGGGGTPPMPLGDYIWYDYNPVNGFLSDNGVRKVKDKGNTNIAGTRGQHDGTMYSGTSLDGTVEVPKIVEIEDVLDDTKDAYIAGKGGSVVSIISSSPTNIEFETTTIADDTSYDIQFYSYYKNVEDGDVVKIKFTIDLQEDTNADTKIIYIFGHEGDNAVDIPFVAGDYEFIIDDPTATGNISFRINVSNGGYVKANIHNIQLEKEVAVSNVYGFDSNGVFAAREHSMTATCTFVRLNNRTFTQDDIDAINNEPELLIDWYWGNRDLPSGIARDPEDKVWPATEGYDDTLNDLDDSLPITIQGNYRWDNNLNVGLQILRFVNKEVINSNQVRFHSTNDSIKTGVSIDGSADFTSMIGFTLPGDTMEQYLVYSGGGTNRFELMRDDMNIDQNQLIAKIGQYSATMTFDDSKRIHAIFCRYKADTNELDVAIDGQAPTSVGTIVFDGQTGEVQLGTDGSNPFGGDMGEGLLGSSFASDDVWYRFWKRIQGTMCNRPVGEYMFNYNFDCGANGWTNNPSYDATITDNGDGSIHLRADTNYGSVCPVVIPEESADWILEVKVKNQTGTKGGKLSIQKPNNQWDTVKFGSTADCVYQNTYTGEIKSIYVGADNETGFEMDIEYYSLRKVTSNIVTFNGDTVKNGHNTVTYD